MKSLKVPNNEILGTQHLRLYEKSEFSSHSKSKVRCLSDTWALLEHSLVDYFKLDDFCFPQPKINPFMVVGYKKLVNDKKTGILQAGADPENSKRGG